MMIGSGVGAESAMSEPNLPENPPLARQLVAPQQRGPNPLPVFLDMMLRAVDGDQARMRAVLAGVRAYQQHPYVRRLPEPPIAARLGAARLLDYGGSGPPVLFVPSLINPPTVLDLSEGNSLLRWLAAQGVRPLLIDWGSPGERERRLSIQGYVEERLVPLQKAVGEPVSVVGYCLGGTMALAAAAIVPPRRLVLLATPWRFDRYAADARDAVAQHWRSVAPAAAALGAVPMEMIQPMFWRLDPQATAAKYERLARMPPGGSAAAAFVALEDWANDGPPLSLPAARQLFDDFYAGKVPAGVDPGALDLPILNLVAARDRIVPPEAAPEVGVRRDIDAGHVGMVVGSRGPALVWEPLRDFLCQHP